MPIVEPNYKKIQRKPENRLQRMYLLGKLGRGGLDAEQQARQSATEGISTSLMGAENAARRGGAQAFGMGNTSGIPGRLMTEANMAAPFASAEMGAQMAGENSALKFGNASQALQQQLINQYVSMSGPWLQKEALEQQAALSLGAGAGGGGGLMSALGNPVGSAVGSYFGAGGGAGMFG